jgi:hypothetical protein
MWRERDFRIILSEMQLADNRDSDRINSISPFHANNRSIPQIKTDEYAFVYVCASRIFANSAWREKIGPAGLLFDGGLHSATPQRTDAVVYHVVSLCCPPFQK